MNPTRLDPAPTARAVTLHVERTGSGRVLRWVCRSDDLQQRQPAPSDSELGRLVDSGRIEAAGSDAGDILVWFRSESDVEDRTLVREVHRAVSADVASGSWYLPSGPTPVSLRPVRR